MLERTEEDCPVPRISEQDMAQTRRRIVDAASPRFRTDGIDAIGIAALMKDAGMTHGGFYNHFASKDALAVAVFEDAFATSLATLARATDEADPERPSLAETVDAYLSPGHRDMPGGGCPSAALVTDAGRHGPAIQAAYAEGVNGYIAGFDAAQQLEATERGEALDPEAARRRSIALLSEIVGAIVLSRAIRLVDPDLSDEILAVNRQRHHQEH
ncbi:TetR/AcrR family transcriptional regulator [Solirubrobacter phytolaccae]|uniref:TetR/AcrR family transcriptional regulator n=1 Tax=Solirubrobacter phytolaccae TaxID=1404360 RepID=A0A9X3SAR3_9ACTN|nr:TetR/AcrR family transcriptional regulator [Solirubrobacter phytolaccae]MDA0183978.1 TetR/AcrR family transcriptional regulator [Solirubrobacter phytolaccae]